MSDDDSYDDSDYRQMTKDQLIQALDERDERISILEGQLDKKKRGQNVRRGSTESDPGLDVLVDENEKLKENLAEYKLVIDQLREDALESEAKIRAVTDSLKKSESTLKASQKRSNDLEQQIQDTANKSATVQQELQESNKNSTKNTKETRRLYQDIEVLQEANNDLKANLQEKINELDTYYDVVRTLHDEKEQLVIAQEHHQIELDTIGSRHHELEVELEKTREALLAEQESGSVWESQIAKIQSEHATDRSKLLRDMKSQGDEILSLKQLIGNLKDTTAAGEKQQIIDTMRAQLEDLKKQASRQTQEILNKTSDMQKLAAALQSRDKDIDSLVAEKVFAQKNEMMDLKGQIANANRSLTDKIEHIHHLEQGNLELTKDIDELKYWKEVYESNRGLQELNRAIKKMKDENRYQSITITNLTSKIGVYLDGNGRLQTAFDRLKRECGKDEDFGYPESELSEEMQTELMRMRSELKELENQISSLETENSKLRKGLKQQAGIIAEKGLKYAGMSSDMLNSVDDFAQNLKEGNTSSVYFDEKSNDMKLENKRLKEEMKLLGMQLTRANEMITSSYAAGLGSALPQITLPGGNDSNGGGSGASIVQQAQFPIGFASGEITSLRVDMDKILQENKALSDKVSSLKRDLLSAYQNSANNFSQQDDTRRSGNFDNLRNINAVNAPTSDQLSLLMQEMLEVKQAIKGQQHIPSYQERIMNNSNNNNNNNNNNNYNMKADVGSDSDGQDIGTPALAKQNFKLPPSGKGRTVRNNDNNNNNNNNQTAVPSNNAGPSTPFNGAQGQGNGWPHTPFSRVNSFDHLPGDDNRGAAGGLRIPATPSGKSLLQRNLTTMNLPPDEWANEVRDLHAQLIEVLEQLNEREEELEDQRVTNASLEEYLVTLKQKMGVLYADYSQKCDSWENERKGLHTDFKRLTSDKEDLKLRVDGLTAVLDTIRAEDPLSDKAKISEMGRKLMKYEVNENVLSRKYISLSEALNVEQAARTRIENDFIEMENTLKNRILYLEQYKVTSSARLGYLQAKVDASVPQEDFITLMKELDHLREEHLISLRREVEARITALSSQEQARELRGIRLNLNLTKKDLETAQAQVQDYAEQLEDQKHLTDMAYKNVSNAEMSTLVSEMARYRGEASRLEIEMTAARKRSEILEAEVLDIKNEFDRKEAKIEDLEAQMEDATKREIDSRKELRQIEGKFDKGLTSEEAKRLMKQNEKLIHDLEEQQKDATRYKEQAEIASIQAQTLGNFRNDYQKELTELREHCARLESRSDDDVLIGRLQRQLMSQKASYKAFVRKYQLLRGNMRQRELAIRILESRLDQREETVIENQKAYKMEINALKKAIRFISDITEDDGSEAEAVDVEKLWQESEFQMLKPYIKKLRTMKKAGYLTIGQKLSTVSEKLASLGKLAEVNLTRTRAAEDAKLKLKAQVDDLLIEKEQLLRVCSDIDDLRSNSKQGAVAIRVVSLGEEVRSQKLTNMQQKREIQMLKQEKKFLEQIVSKMKGEVEALEESKIDAENRPLLAEGLPSIDMTEGGSGSRPRFFDIDANDDVIRAQKSSKVLEPILKKTTVSLKPDNEEYVKKIEGLTGAVNDARRETSQFKIKHDAMSSRIQELESLIRDRENQVDYYERMAASEGLPTMTGNKTATRPKSASSRDMVNSNLAREEQEKLQQAASATIGSLKSLLEEKNRTIERYRQKIDDLQNRPSQRKSRADKAADDILGSSDLPSSKGRGDESGSDGFDQLRRENGQLSGQLEKADEILMEKDRFVSQLEQKLLVQSNARERAEIRCTEALQEIELMKRDVVELIEQLQASNRKLHQAGIQAPALAVPASVANNILSPKKASKATPSSSESKHDDDNQFSGNNNNNMSSDFNVEGFELLERKVDDLNSNLKAKDKKIKEYRDIVIRLKEEFLKSEQEKAVTLLEYSKMTNGQAGNGNGNGPKAGSGIKQEELSKYQESIAEFKVMLKSTKEQLEKSETRHQKLIAARKQDEEKMNKIHEEILRVEAEASRYQEELQTAKKQVEVHRRQEMKVRDILKQTERDPEKLEELRAIAMKSEQLQRKNEILEAQVVALRKLQDGMAPSNFSHSSAVKADGHALDASPPNKSNTLNNNSSNNNNNSNNRENSNNTNSNINDYMLGTGNGPQSELQQQLQAKWENEKKLQKRVSTLEKRLQEKITECEDLQAELVKAKETAKNLAQTNADMQKKRASGSGSGATDSKRSAVDLNDLEEARAKVYQLEEENTHFRRKVEVDYPQEVASLRHQLSSMRSKLKDAEDELVESDSRRKRAETGSRSLRDSEDQFIREEMLKEEINKMKRQKLELEAAVLDRDAHAIESRFEFEAREEEVLRLRRRVQELQSAVQSLHRNQEMSALETGSAAPRVAWPATSGPAGSKGSVREKELEVTVDAMKKVIEKLKVDNDKMKRGAGGVVGPDGASPGAKAPMDWEKKAKIEKARSEKLEEENKNLAAKVKTSEDVNQKLSERQQQVTSLRGQLKKNQDDAASLRTQFETEREMLKGRLASADDRIRALEGTIQQLSSKIMQKGDHSSGDSMSVVASSNAAQENVALKRRVIEFDEEVSSLRRQLQDSKKMLESLQSGGNAQVSIVEYRRLKEENEKLKIELSAFDVDFFEEIESLKFAHHEATQKLIKYEASMGKR